MARAKSVEAAKAAVDNAIDEYLRARFAEAITFTQNGIHPAKRRGRKPGPKPGSRRKAREVAESEAPATPPVVTRARKARAKKAEA